jgi:DNA polymerase-1
MTMDKQNDKDLPRIIYVDVETTVRCPITNNKAHPMWPSNEIVATGATDESTSEVQLHYTPLSNSHTLPKGVVFVGQNINFDLAHLYKIKDHDYYPYSIRDIGVAEYLLTAQETLFPSLDGMSIKYGLPVKDNRIKEMWDKGVQTEDIPKEMLLSYLERDVLNTKEIFHRQVVELQKEGLINLYRVQSEAQLALLEMYRRGMYINKVNLNCLKASTEDMMKIETAKLEGVLPGINPASNQQVSRAFFGGYKKVKEKEVIGLYKNGNPKTKVVEKEVYDAGIALDPKLYGATPTEYGFSVGEDVLKKITEAVSPTPTPAVAAATILLHIRKLNKEYSTYIQPLETLTFPSGYVHGNINNTATKTGRYSSTNPNLQNITDYSDVKTVFSSRFGDDGVIVSADFNQLEVVALAYLSQDPQLIEDINSGRDIHTELYIGAFDRIPTSAERKAFKPVTFALTYGAGWKNIVAQTGLSESQVKDFIEAFQNRYPKVIQWWEFVAGCIVSTRTHTGRRDSDGKPIGESIYVLPTGRKLLFLEYWGDPILGTGGRVIKPAKASFSPTQMKNYPVQSFATGDVVPMILGKVFRRLQNNELLRDSAVLINTQHDSIILDCMKEALPQLHALLAEEMTKVKEYLQEEFEIDDFNLNVTVKVTSDLTWKETKAAIAKTYMRKHNTGELICLEEQ